MIRTRFFSTRFALALVLVLIMATSAFAFANSNTVTVTSAGDGAAAISGFTVGAVVYNLVSTDPSKISSVAFTLTPNNGNPAPITVKAKLNAASTTWYTCSVATSIWTCSVTDSLTVVSADDLRVVAVQ